MLTPLGMSFTSTWEYMRGSERLTLATEKHIVDVTLPYGASAGSAVAQLLCGKELKSERGHTHSLTRRK